MRQSSRQPRRLARSVGGPQLVLWAVTAAVALAGCGEGKGGAGQVALGDGTRITLDLPENRTPDPEDIWGAVSGIVIDEAIFPVASARVSVSDRPWAATTDGNGLFAFDRVPPGLYELVVEAPAFLDGLGTLNVKSGQVAKSILQIQREPFVAPYHTTLKVEVTASALQFEAAKHLIPFDGRPATVIVESVWRGLIAVGEAPLRYAITPETRPEEGSSGYGPNPLRLEFAADFFPEGEYAVRVDVRPQFPLPPETRGDVFVTTFYVDAAPAGWSLVEGDA